MEQALKNQIITVFVPMYLKNPNNEIVGFDKINALGILDYLFISYVSIKTVDLENIFDNMHKAWDSHQMVNTVTSREKGGHYAHDPAQARTHPSKS